MTVPPYTLADLRSGLVDHGFADMLVPRQDELINDAYMDVCSREAWTFLEKETDINTSAGNAALALPADFNQARSMTIDSVSQIVTPIREDTFRKMTAGGYTDSGVPEAYYFIGGQTAGAPVCNLWPVPDSTYSVKLAYMALPTTLVNASDVPLIPAQHQRVILMGALVNAYQLEDEIQMSQRQEQLFEKRLVQMRDDLMVMQIDRPEYVLDLYRDDALL